MLITFYVISWTSHMQSPYGMKYYGNGSSMKTDVLPLLITKIIFVMSKKKNFVLETSQDHSGMKA